MTFGQPTNAFLFSSSDPTHTPNIARDARRLAESAHPSHHSPGRNRFVAAGHLRQHRHQFLIGPSCVVSLAGRKSYVTQRFGSPAGLKPPLRVSPNSAAQPQPHASRDNRSAPAAKRGNLSTPGAYRPHAVVHEKHPRGRAFGSVVTYSIPLIRPPCCPEPCQDAGAARASARAASFQPPRLLECVLGVTRPVTHAG